MEWAARPEHLGGIPRKLLIAIVGTFAKTVSSFLNTTSVHNADTLLHLVRSRPRRVPLITVSNHMSTSAHALFVFFFSFSFSFFMFICECKWCSVDDPAMWGFKGFPIFDTQSARWVLAAEDICFRNALYSYIFRVGKSTNFTSYLLCFCNNDIW